VLILGLEPINKSCSCVENELRSRVIQDEFGYLPLDLDAYIKQQYNEHNRGEPNEQ